MGQPCVCRLAQVLERHAPTLGWLSLAGNALTRLPDALGGLAALRYLDLSGNALEALPAGVLVLPSLQARPAAPAAQQPVKTAPVSVLRPPSLQAGPAAHPAGPSARALPGGAPQGRGSGSADAPAGRSGGARSRRS